MAPINRSVFAIISLLSSVLLFTACSFSGTTTPEKSDLSLSSLTERLKTASSIGSPLGTFTFANESASQGNILALPFQRSDEGEQLGLFWGTSQPLINVVSAGNDKYNLIETYGQRCITIEGSSASPQSGSRILITTCSSSSVASANQLFSFILKADGSYSIQGSNGLCLTANGAFSSAVAITCSQANSQLWQIANLNISSGSVSTPTPVQPTPIASPSPTPVPTSAPTATPEPPVIPVSGGNYQLINVGVSTGNIAGIAYGTSSENNLVNSYFDVGQSLTLSVISDLYNITENVGGRCVSISTSAVVIQTCSQAAAPLFRLIAQSDGSYQIVSSTNVCLELDGAYQNVVAKSCSVSVNQHWKLKAVRSSQIATPTPIPAPTATPVPTPIQATPTPIPSPVTSAGLPKSLVLYNWNPSVQLAHYISAKSQIEAGSLNARAKVIAIGDSLTSGVGSAPVGVRDRSYPTELAKYFSVDGVPAQADNFLGNGLYVDSRISLIGSTVNSGATAAGGQVIQSVNSGDGFDFVIPTAGNYDHLDIHYIDSYSGKFTVSIDGGQVLATLSIGSSGSMASQTISIPTGYHSKVSIRQTGPQPFFIEGVAFWSAVSPKVEVYNAGQGGTDSGYVAATSLTGTGMLQGAAEVMPKLALINFGANDILNSTETSAQSAANLQKAIIQLRSIGCDPVLIIPHPFNSGNYAAGIVALQASLRQLSDSMNVPLIDLSATFDNNLSELTNLGLLADGIHGTATFYDEEAASLANLLK